MKSDEGSCATSHRHHRSICQLASPAPGDVAIHDFGNDGALAKASAPPTLNDLCGLPNVSACVLPRSADHAVLNDMLFISRKVFCQQASRAVGLPLADLQHHAGDRAFFAFPFAGLFTIRHKREGRGSWLPGSRDGKREADDLPPRVLGLGLRLRVLSDRGLELVRV